MIYDPPPYSRDEASRAVRRYVKGCDYYMRKQIVDFLMGIQKNEFQLPPLMLVYPPVTGKNIGWCRNSWARYLGLIEYKPRTLKSARKRILLSSLFLPQMIMKTRADLFPNGRDAYFFSDNLSFIYGTALRLEKEGFCWTIHKKSYPGYGSCLRVNLQEQTISYSIWKWGDIAPNYRHDLQQVIQILFPEAPEAMNKPLFYVHVHNQSQSRHLQRQAFLERYGKKSLRYTEKPIIGFWDDKTLSFCDYPEQ